MKARLTAAVLLDDGHIEPISGEIEYTDPQDLPRAAMSIIGKIRAVGGILRGAEGNDLEWTFIPMERIREIKVSISVITINTLDEMPRAPSGPGGTIPFRKG